MRIMVPRSSLPASSMMPTTGQLRPSEAIWPGELLLFLLIGLGLERGLRGGSREAAHQDKSGCDIPNAKMDGSHLSIVPKQQPEITL